MNTLNIRKIERQSSETTQEDQSTSVVVNEDTTKTIVKERQSTQFNK